ncbi:uncharacterized protein LOC121408570 [Lytechinus variegatus]|uniref:uncharacterized protein LOC121408570 n=1 Tax=Lytechinus variegatus TaxID=7654 RepID=UPI001BB153FC|nr:uncharacterized protein LOC121408570 [Lytechinus variegatus]
MNVGTVFSTGGMKHADVRQHLKTMLQAVQTCSECITSKAKECTYRNQQESCNRCRSRNLQCVRLMVVHCYADMAASQRVAHEDLMKEAGCQLAIPQYTQFGFGMLHMCKALVGYVRNYRITDGNEIFCINMLVALWLSSTHASTLLCGINSKVFSYRDRHSDDLAYSTVCQRVEDALVAANSVVVTVAPEQYRPWSQEAKDHNDMKLGRPLFITVNKQGHCLWSDPVADCVFMGNRHNPMKVKPLGQPNAPGRASHQVLPVTAAQYNRPTGLKVFAASNKGEVCLISDSGNKALRVVDKCHDIHAKQKVATVELNNAPDGFQPYALEVISPAYPTTIAAVSDTNAKVIHMIRINLDSYHGQLVKTIEGFCVQPSGLALLTKTPPSLLAVDHTEIKMVNYETGVIKTFISGLHPSTDVSVSRSKKLAVSTPVRNKIYVYDMFTIDAGAIEVWGSGQKGNEDGTVADASFDEPVGVAFDGDVLFVSCFGGEHGGCVKFVSGISFAVSYIQHVRELYHFAGFVARKDSRKEDARQMRRGKFLLGVRKFQESIEFLQAINERRQNALSNGATPKYVDSSCGGIYPKTLDCLLMTLSSLRTHITSFEEMLPDTIDDLSLYAFVNEAVVEHGFGERGAHSSQYRHPSHEQYCHIKTNSEGNYIRKICSVKYSHFTTEEKQYQHPRKCDISADIVISQLHERLKNYTNLCEPTQESKEDYKKLKKLNRIYRPQPTQTVREKYKAKNGYAPVTVQRKDVPSESYMSQRNLSALTSFQGTLSKTRKTQLNTEDFLLMRGDIVPVLAGANYAHDGPQIDNWWLLQVTEPVLARDIGERTRVTDMWLDKVAVNYDGTNTFKLLDDTTVKIPFGSLIKDIEDGDPLVVPVDVFSTEFDADNMDKLVYSFHPEYIQQLDDLGEEAQYQLNQDNESDLEEEEDDDVNQQNRQHQHLLILEQRRSRAISSKGRQFTSYLDLLKHKN